MLPRFRRLAVRGFDRRACLRFGAARFATFRFRGAEDRFLWVRFFMRPPGLLIIVVRVPNAIVHRL